MKMGKNELAEFSRMLLNKDYEGLQALLDSVEVAKAQRNDYMKDFMRRTRVKNYQKQMAGIQEVLCSSKSEDLPEVVVAILEDKYEELQRLVARNIALLEEEK